MDHSLKLSHPLLPLAENVDLPVLMVSNHLAAPSWLENPPLMAVTTAFMALISRGTQLLLSLGSRSMG